ncbi:MAG TPA: hypothetical protein VIM73_13860, partial [Polyangiaceae bacterium]
MRSLGRAACCLSWLLSVTPSCRSAVPSAPPVEAPTESAGATAPPAAREGRSRPTAPPREPEPPAAAPPVNAATSESKDETFPPPPIAPPHARSAHDGDGEWVALAASGDRAAVGKSALYKT